MQNRIWSESELLRVNRRSFLVGSASAAVLAACRSSTKGASVKFSENPFALGVASGDPLEDSVIIWTRLAPQPLDELGLGGLSAPRIDVEWEVSSEEGFGRSLSRGTYAANPELGYSVHAEVFGLEPGREYFYRFRSGGEISAVGRTKTAPASRSDVSALRFAVASCQSFPSGEYGAHAGMADEDLDFVAFLGDYIYEYAGKNEPRGHLGGEAHDLPSYRLRYAQYKSDANLQANHAAHPWIATWDDHETENDYADSTSSEGESPASFLKRRAMAYQVYYENMPLRLKPPSGPDYEIFRSFDYGSLAKVIVIDTRQYRTAQACMDQAGALPIPPKCDELEDTDMLGDKQFRWLEGQFKSSRAKWNVLANQTVMTAMPIPIGDPPLVNTDQWDGYPATRRKVLEAMTSTNLSNPLVVTGDIHLAGMGLVRNDLTGEAVAVEVVGSSVTSGFPTELVGIVSAVAEADPDVVYVDGEDRGYARVELSDAGAKVDFRYVVDLWDASKGVRDGESFWIPEGRVRIEKP